MPRVETFNKELVLKQATAVFHDKGYNATSMQDLVDATGLNRSSLYNSFGSKLDLYMECLKSYQDGYMLKISEVLQKAENSLNAIELIFDLYLQDTINDPDDRGCMLTNCKSEMAHHEACITKFLNRNQETFLALLEDLVAKGQREGGVNDNRTPKEYALYLFSSIQGFRTIGILISNKNDLQSVINTTIQTLI
ncbi:TetR/AcrR family transcriptional regulator [Flavobacterium litorale]|uniref:TetR/AcrR family transcriptional regulator n=1 Tax=Flavobacterium litorale TaxID=2856519 RepID=A0ABX8V992_9FLAO|nr:TetR/AcrR family transcriptional regulator [Flavobacterium litorale]QYJ67226.1 TetR/AcrR family transcriptional regulator [Flavobacterium litorale]